MKIEYLSWDSEFFGKKIGKINCCTSDEMEFAKLLTEAQETGYQLLYIFDQDSLYFDQHILDTYNGRLVDTKVVYSLTINDLELKETIAKEYNSQNLTDEFETLAYLSGNLSRFRLDKGFDPHDFYRLYKIWMTKSLSKEIADKVFVVSENEKIAGMVTLKINNEIGTIGLFAVSESVQGRGYGKNLINACSNELISKGIFQIEVPTQMENLKACSFYEKCGFNIKSITNIYHFWL